MSNIFPSGRLLEVENLEVRLRVEEGRVEVMAKDWWKGFKVLNSVNSYISSVQYNTEQAI